MINDNPDSLVDDDVLVDDDDARVTMMMMVMMVKMPSVTPWKRQPKEPAGSADGIRSSSMGPKAGAGYRRVSRCRL
jgi:hypothetical protein